LTAIRVWRQSVRRLAVRTDGGRATDSVEAEVGRFELCDCDMMLVAQLVEMSHIEPAARPKKPEGGRHGIPPLKPLLPCRPTQLF